MRNTVISILLIVAGATPGCINADPSNFPPRDAGVVVEPDVTNDWTGDADPYAACRACLAAPEDPGPGCGTALTTYLEDPKGPIIFECGFRRGCWSLPMQSDIISCAFPCFTEAGVTSFGDPVVEKGTPVLACILGVCQPACGASQ